MRGPEADGRDREEEVLPRLERPGPGNCEVNAHGVPGEGFDCRMCAAVPGVAVDEDREAEESLEGPAYDDDFEVRC